MSYKDGKIERREGRGGGGGGEDPMLYLGKSPNTYNTVLDEKGSEQDTFAPETKGFESVAARLPCSLLFPRRQQQQPLGVSAVGMACASFAARRFAASSACRRDRTHRRRLHLHRHHRVNHRRRIRRGIHRGRRY